MRLARVGEVRIKVPTSSQTARALLSYTYGMKLFNPTTFTWWQVGALKWAALLIGIAIGSRWPQTFAPLGVPILVIALVLSVYVTLVWAKNKE